MTADFTYWFRTIAPYLRTHRGKRCVFLLPNHLFDSAGEAELTALTHDLAILHSLGLELIITFSGQPFINDWAPDQPLTPDDLRALTHVCSERQAKLQSLLSMNLPHLPMHGAQVQVCSGNWLTAKPYGIHEGTDYQHLGHVRKLMSQHINQQLHHNAIIIQMPLADSPTGERFGLAASDAALALATELQADKLIILSNLAPIQQLDGTYLYEIQPDHFAPSHLPENAQYPIQLAIKANQQGVSRCHIINPLQDGCLLLELFSREGCGTLVTEQAFERIRTAQLSDISEIMTLIQPLEKAGIVIHRSQQLLTQDIHNFYVVERDQSVIACAALYPFPEEQMAELACIAVSPDYQKTNRGAHLLSYLEKQARHQGCKHLFVLTTQTRHWFQQQGFTPSTIKSLPPNKLNAYNSKRGSQVLIKIL